MLLLVQLQHELLLVLCLVDERGGGARVELAEAAQLAEGGERRCWPHATKAGSARDGGGF